jgi:spore photoproduct lyase
MAEQDWPDPSHFVKKIHVESSCLDLPYTREILDRSGLPWRTVADGEKPDSSGNTFSHSLTAGKQELFLCTNRGIFFKPCPGTREYRCCGYQVLNTGSNCPIDCVYCILQAYLNTPWLLHYVNVERMFEELDRGLAAQPAAFFRVGTGEFSDSLALDRLTGLSRPLVAFFAGKHNAVIELKTKSASIANLQGLDHRGRTVVAWSLNSPRLIKEREIRSASLSQRLAAARRCAEWGYRLAFHFDPLIIHPGWEEGYAETIAELFRQVPAEAIAWISLGALRFIPRLKDTALQRFPGTRIYHHEFVCGLDGKARYFRPERVRLYRHIYQLLRRKAAETTCIYFCMESDEVWQEVMGFTPAERGGLPVMLDSTVR